MARGSPYSTVRWQRTRRAVLTRDRYVCQLCGRLIDPLLPGNNPDGGSADHIVSPLDGGAMFDLGNLRACHMRCNSRRQALRSKAQRRRNPS